MSGRPLQIYGSKILRKQAKPVSEVTPALKRLANDMLEAMYASSGIGLAAPQVGELLRLIVVDIAGDDEARKPIVFFNPIITETQGQCVAEEGCLSIPDVWASVTRPETISVKALDQDGTPFDLKGVSGLLARCIQHEIDHLEGVLFVDKISATDRLLNDSKLKKMSRKSR